MFCNFSRFRDTFISRITNVSCHFATLFFSLNSDVEFYQTALCHNIWNSIDNFIGSFFLSPTDDFLSWRKKLWQFCKKVFLKIIFENIWNWCFICHLVCFHVFPTAQLFGISTKLREKQKEKKVHLNGKKHPYWHCKSNLSDVFPVKTRN